MLLSLVFSVDVRAASLFAKLDRRRVERERAFCQTLLDDAKITVRPRGGGDRDLAFGDRVELVNDGVAGLPAYFLGRVRDRAYFTSTRTMHPSRTSFYLPADRVRSGPPITMDDAVEPIRCAARTVMLCLEHLDRQGVLAEDVRTRLHGRRDELFAELDQKMGMGHAERRPEVAGFDAYVNGAGTRKERERRVQETRLATMRVFGNDLRAWDVSANVTASVGRLVRHLRRGRPAYVSVMGMPAAVYRPHAREWWMTLAGDHPDATVGTLPRPFRLNVPTVSRAVYAVGVLPAARGLLGRTLGPRVVVLDPYDGGLNVWPSLLLRISHGRRFLLIGSGDSAPRP